MRGVTGEGGERRLNPGSQSHRIFYAATLDRIRNTLGLHLPSFVLSLAIGTYIPVAAFTLVNALNDIVNATT